MMCISHCFLFLLFCLFIRVSWKFFLHGACYKGDYCEFSHDFNDQPDNVTYILLTATYPLHAFNFKPLSLRCLVYNVMSSMPYCNDFSYRFAHFTREVHAPMVAVADMNMLQ